MRSLAAFFGSNKTFVVLVAAGMVALRVVSYDDRFLSGELVPNHDMSQGLAFFATNMHSLRLSGELAFWNPTGFNGYGQYYQSFFSPLAPTPHHITFIVWAQAMQGLDSLGIVVPEYYQYIVFNYLLLPFLAALAFAALTSMLFRHRSTMLLVSIAWTLSGTGMWNSAWFYFQEATSLFFVLATCVAALRRPSSARILLLVAAVVLQLTSVNYWTVYNFFLVVIFLGTYGWVYPQRVRRLARRVVQLCKRRPVMAGLVALGSLAAIGVWSVVLGSILREQSGCWIRHDKEAYTQDQALGRTQEMRRYTLELFMPDIRKTMSYYMIINPAHNARYLGCGLLPLLLVFFVRRWGRQDRWFFLCGVGVLCVCFAPPLLLQVWDRIPMMNRVWHIFYFYTHYWQMLLIFCAGTGFEFFLRLRHNAAMQRRIQWLLIVVGIGLLSGFLAANFLSHRHKHDDPLMEGAVRFCLLTSIAAALLWQRWVNPTTISKRFFACVMLTVTLADLSRYFAEANRWDTAFTEHHIAKMTDAAREQVALPWKAPDATKGFEGDLAANMPLTNSFWPLNTFLRHRDFLLCQDGPAPSAIALEGAPLKFFRSAQESEPPTAEELKKIGCAVPTGTDFTFTDEAQGPEAALFAWEWLRWEYNRFRMQLNVPADGWVLIRQLPDPRWHVTLDDEPVTPVRANSAAMAVPVRKGACTIELDYRPAVREFYWSACWLLEAVTAGILTLAGFALRRRAQVCAGAGAAHDGLSPQVLRLKRLVRSATRHIVRAESTFAVGVREEKS